MDMNRTEQWLKNVSTMNDEELAAQLAALAEDYPNYAEDPAGLANLGRMVAVVEAIAVFKFPDSPARDAA
jgi:hypothetical protein